MDQSARLLVSVTEAILIAANLAAVFVLRGCMNQHPTQSWRQVMLYTWLCLGLIVSSAQIVVIVVGCPPLPVMRILLWLDRTVIFVGYLSVLVTCLQLKAFFRNAHDA